MRKHLTFEDRLSIQEGLSQNKKMSQIAEEIGKSRTTVSREVKAHGTHIQSEHNNCVNRRKCNLPAKCLNPTCISPLNCSSGCSGCRAGCPDYLEDVCEKSQDYPYGCNACGKRYCLYSKHVYLAKEAQKEYEEMLSESRKGISLSEEELNYLDETISPLLKKGLSVTIACNEHRDEIMVSGRTVYSYLDAGLLSAGKLDLKRTVQRKRRKKSGPEFRVDKGCHLNRTYEDFCRYMEEHPDTAVVQMDSVIGRKGGKCLLTLLFRNCDLQLMYLRERNTAKTVSETFSSLRKTLGEESYRMMFPVILTDRGSEFTDPGKIEQGEEDEGKLCRVYYCEPMNSNQKSNCERNHEFIRYIIPKGNSMDEYSQKEIDRVMNHVNSYPRMKWNGKSPLEVFTSIYGEEAARKLGLEKVSPDSIILTPELLK